jgi:hypothetical protein
MALQYDAPTTGADFSDAINSNVGISASTAAAISSLLGLDNPGSSVVLAGWDGVGAVSAPADQPVDVLAIKTTGAAGTDTDLVLPDSVADAKVIIIDSETNVSLTVTEPVAAEARAFAFAADATATPDLIINGGNGNDTLTYVGTGNVVLDGGNGDDVLITGSGNDVVTGGAGDDHIETGAGNDTIVTGLGNDVILAGAGRDLIQVEGASTDFDVTVKGSFLQLGDANASGNSVTIQGGEFVTFTDNHTLAIVETDAEASALRLFDGLLGRDVDNASAEFYSTAVQNGASLTDIASSFLASNEYKSAVNSQFLSETYLGLLGRAADDSAQTYWQDQLASGKTQAEVAALISTSAEAQVNGQSNDDFISALYTNALGRGAVAEDTSYWVGALIGGSTRADVAASIYSSTEATHHANAELIDSLYSNALGSSNVPDTDAGKAAWIAAVDNGTLTQADAVIGIVGSPAGVDHNTNVVVVHGAV